MKALTGLEAKQVALAIEPKVPNRKVLCPLCGKSFLNVEKISVSRGNRFALMVRCTECDFRTHFDCGE